MPVDHAIAPALRARLLGTTLLAAGIGVVVAAAVVTLAGMPGAVLTGLVLVVALLVLTLAVLLGPRRWVLRLDETGYRVRGLRVAPRAARWTDVHEVQASTVPVPRARRTVAARCLVVHLRDGRSATLPVDVLDVDADDLAHEVAELLARAHGRPGPPRRTTPRPQARPRASGGA